MLDGNVFPSEDAYDARVMKFPIVSIYDFFSDGSPNFSQLGRAEAEL